MPLIVSLDDFGGALAAAQFRRQAPRCLSIRIFFEDYLASGHQLEYKAAHFWIHDKSGC